LASWQTQKCLRIVDPAFVGRSGTFLAGTGGSLGGQGAETQPKR